jgi:hypothetical protein
VKFIHRFSPSVLCELETTEEMPAKGESHVLNVIWSGRPKRKHVPEYIRWMHLVNQRCAEMWSAKIMHCFQLTPHTWKFWTYEPGKAPQCIDPTREPGAGGVNN